MDELMKAIEQGEYGKAYEALRRTPEWNSPVGPAVGAFLLALIDRWDEAQALCANLPGIAVIVNGERERSARWRDARSGLRVAVPTPTTPLYAAMASALATGDQALAERTKAELEGKHQPVAGTLTFADGKSRAFKDVRDCDDAIGGMLEAYCGPGLLYFPFAELQRVVMLPKTNFMDFIMPKAQIIDRRGNTANAYVPLLYANSALHADPFTRNGRMTNFAYLGKARRGLGQRDFMFDGAMIGLQSVGAIDFG